jgi:peptide-methionine (S)-S-oxide reductase
MIARTLTTAIGLCLMLAGVALAQDQDTSPSEKKKTETTANQVEKMEKATFGGGCFWCLEAVFERLKGVKSVVSGYAGGSTKKPNYATVSSGMTGHAEVIQIDYDPKQISYQNLVDVFFACHDPTTLNRQGPDEGTQYRSVILYHDEAQHQIAAQTMQKLNASGLYIGPIVTQIVPMKGFTAAEKHHQDYYRRNLNTNPYCQMYITPKLQELQMKLQKVEKVTKGH